MELFCCNKLFQPPRSKLGVSSEESRGFPGGKCDFHPYKVKKTILADYVNLPTILRVCEYSLQSFFISNILLPLILVINIFSLNNYPKVIL